MKYTVCENLPMHARDNRALNVIASPLEIFFFFQILGCQVGGADLTRVYTVHYFHAILFQTYIKCKSFRAIALFLCKHIVYFFHKLELKIIKRIVIKKLSA